MQRNRVECGEWVLEPIPSSLHLKEFDCGDPEMNMYFRHKSAKYRKHLLVQSYHFCPIGYEDTIPVMLADLCNDSVCRKMMPPEVLEQIHVQKRYLETFPAVKIARLGRHLEFRGLGITKHLFNALKIFFTQENRTGCRFLTLDAYPERVPLYESCGFTRTLLESETEPGRPVSMLFDLKSFDPEK